MIEYAITAGEGTLLAYGVAWEVMSCDGIIRVTETGDGRRYDEDYYNDTNAVVLSRFCPDDCETGK